MTHYESFERNIAEISRLKEENRTIANQMWEHKYKENLGVNNYFTLDDVIQQFSIVNGRSAELRLFADETYNSFLNSIYSLLLRANKYKLQVPEYLLDIMCYDCVCCNCESHCYCATYSCETCRKNYGCGYRYCCDE